MIRERLPDYRLTIWITAALFSAVGVGVGIGHRLWAPDAVIELPAAEKRQADGSLVLERKPDPKAKPAHKLPPASKPQRIAKVTVQPKREDCPPVTVDVTLVKQADGQRIIASSPDGRVISGMDIPLVGLAPARKWASGLTYEPVHDRFGAFIERDVGRLRLGIDAQQTRDGSLEARLRVGWTY